MREIRKSSYSRNDGRKFSRGRKDSRGNGTVSSSSKCGKYLDGDGKKIRGPGHSHVTAKAAKHGTP